MKNWLCSDGDLRPIPAILILVLFVILLSFFPILGIIAGIILILALKKFFPENK